MKSTSLRLIIAFILIIGTVYAVSVIATPETIILAMTLTAFMLLTLIVRATFYIVFKVLKWIVIIAVIGLILTSLF